MKKVPFYANHDDNMHCAVAVYRMLFEHFMDRRIGWAEMDKMADYTEADQSGPAIWERMRNQGFDVAIIDEDTEALDVDTLLKEGRLVVAKLSGKSIGARDACSTHAVLVIGKDGDDYVVHDPGMPPRPNHKLTAFQLDTAFGDCETPEVIGVKYKPIPIRADVMLSQMHPLYSRAALAKLFDKGLVKLGDRVLKAGDKVPSNSQIDAELSPLQPENSDIDLPILYEDNDCMVINKPAGVLTHAQGAFTAEASVATFLRNKVVEMTGDRAGVVHRLDRATSGVIIGAKNPTALSFLQKQFAERKAKKTYMAIVEGHLKQSEAIVDMPIERNPKLPATFRVGANGKPAKTHYKVVDATDSYSLVELKPETGRTHQLRVHMAQLGHPIVGDPLYGSGTFEDRLYLHALSLEITLPETRERKTFTAPLPPEFNELMGKSDG